MKKRITVLVTFMLLLGASTQVEAQVSKIACVLAKKGGKALYSAIKGYATKPTVKPSLKPYVPKSTRIYTPPSRPNYEWVKPTVKIAGKAGKAYVREDNKRREKEKEERNKSQKYTYPLRGY